MDLSPLKITDTAENPWFSGTYFAKYSYPFELPLTDEYDRVFGFIRNHNSAAVQTLIEGIYVHGDKMEKAVLEVEEMQTTLSVTLRYGLEEFPSFGKKLAELPLLRLPVENIYTHAASIISQAWPAVNYNFPQVHIDKIETEDNIVWESFEKIINNYQAGAFLENTVDLEEEITYNRNIIQPVPYLLYLIKAGIEAEGWTLHGDILENTLIQKLLVYADSEYYTDISQESLQILLLATDYDTIEEGNWNYPHITLVEEYTIEHPGKYRITGNVRIRSIAPGEEISMRIFYRDTILTNFVIENPILIKHDGSIDIDFETLADGGADTIRVEYDAGFHENDVLFDLYVNPVRLHDEEGAAIPSIINQNLVDLAKAVPDMNFGELVKIVLAMFNMDLDPREGNQIWINYITKEMKLRPVIDLSMHEVKWPKRKFNKGNSFLLKYQDPGSDVYRYEEVFQDASGFMTTGFTKGEKNTDIEIAALPLPLLLRNEVQTAHGFSTEKTKPFFILYNGLQGGLNLSLDPAALTIPNLHIQYHEEWMRARINATAYEWSFVTTYEKLIGLAAKSRVHAFTNIHLVKRLEMTEVHPDLFDVEIETEILE